MAELAKRDEGMAERTAEAKEHESAGPRSPAPVRLALLHVLAHREDAAVDDTLVAALADPAVRATAAFLLGRIGWKGYPRRARPPRLLGALRPHLDDATPFLDPFYGKTFRSGDFALGAFVRLAGPERFHSDGGEVDEFIGYELPRLTDSTRAQLLAQARALPIPAR